MILDRCARIKGGLFRNNSPTDIQAGIAQIHKIVEDKTCSDISYPLLIFTTGE